MKLTEKQKDFIKENYADEVDEAINNEIDRALTSNKRNKQNYQGNC